ncbi:hypothetical protein [Pseudovibrio sp. JE062]|uniref:hypothetical protein n=1 Tax=Pseudovibrio sp. JE062 TaxID=439495 RepID=UPI000186B7CD|nr:hypothetical protein [Pseudovibrio sp. JE062]EEA95778.1 hypothetical protein PJE062_4816 [Pseudovibrio sp. JE062]
MEEVNWFVLRKCLAAFWKGLRFFVEVNLFLSILLFLLTLIIGGHFISIAQQKSGVWFAVAITAFVFVKLTWWSLLGPALEKKFPNFRFGSDDD